MLVQVGGDELFSTASLAVNENGGAAAGDAFRHRQEFLQGITDGDERCLITWRRTRRSSQRHSPRPTSRSITQNSSSCACLNPDAVLLLAFAVVTIVAGGAGHIAGRR